MKSRKNRRTVDRVPAAPRGDELLHPISDAARRLNVSVTTLKRIAQRGELKLVRLTRPVGPLFVAEAEIQRIARGE